MLELIIKVRDCLDAEKEPNYERGYGKAVELLDAYLNQRQGPDVSGARMVNVRDL